MKVGRATHVSLVITWKNSKFPFQPLSPLRHSQQHSNLPGLAPILAQAASMERHVFNKDSK